MSQTVQHFPQVDLPQRMKAFSIKGLDRVELAAPKLMHERSGGLQKLLTRAGRITQLRDPAGHVLLIDVTEQSRDLDYVNRSSPGREHVLGDFQVDPHPPLATTPLAGKVIR